MSPTETNAIPERQPAEPPSTPGQSNPRERPLAPAEPRPEARPGERSEAREVPVRTPSATRASEPAAADLELKVVVRQAQASARGWEREETRSGRPGALFGADGRATPLQREQGPTPRFQAGAGLNRSAESTLLRHEPMLGVGPAPSPLNDSIQQPIVPSNTMAPGEDNGPVRLEKLAEVLKQRVRRSLEEIAKGPRQLELRLDPPRLGKIQIELTLQPDSTVTARIQAENPQALAALGSQLPELRERLAQAGVELRDFSLGQNSQNPFQQPHEGQQRRRGRHQAEAQTARPRRDSGLSLRV